MTDREIIQLIASTMRRIDQQTAPHFSGTHESDAAAILRALKEAGAL